MNYSLLFKPERMNSKDSQSDLVLVPVIVDGKGDSFAMKKAVKTVKQAYLFDSGFTLAQFIEEEGGFDGVKAIIDAREDNAAEAAVEAGADVLTQQEEDDLLDAMDDGPEEAARKAGAALADAIAPTVEDGLHGDVFGDDEGC